MIREAIEITRDALGCAAFVLAVCALAFVCIGCGG